MTREERIMNMQEKLEAREKMPKSAAKDFGSAVTRLIEETWEKRIKNGLYGIGTDAAREIIFSTGPSVKTIDKRIPALEKVRKRFPNEQILVDGVIEEAKRIQSEVSHFVTAFEKFAAEAERQAAIPKPEKPDGPYIPPASRVTIKTVQEMLHQCTAELEERTADSIEAGILRIIEDFKKKSQKAPIMNLAKTFGRTSIETMTLQKMVRRDIDDSGFTPTFVKEKAPLVLKNDAEAQAKAMAERDAKHIVDKFKYKSVSKLAPVVEGFPEIEDISMNVSGSRGAIEGKLYLSFTDKRSFSLKSQIVTCVSPNGLWFAKYPTTFHDYKQGEDLIKRMPSQAEMVEYGKGPGAASPGMG